jgi:hypothetical protein
VNLPVKIGENLYFFQAFHSVFHSVSAAKKILNQVGANPALYNKPNNINDFLSLECPTLLSAIPL